MFLPLGAVVQVAGFAFGDVDVIPSGPPVLSSSSMTVSVIGGETRISYPSRAAYLPTVWRRLERSRLVTNTMVVAEIVWVLESYNHLAEPTYRAGDGRIAWTV
jgi:hypothetical protein